MQVDSSSLDADSLLRKIAHAPCPGAAPGNVVHVFPRVGSVIDGRYRLDAQLGKGGMGVVFAARNVKTGRDVALKLMANREFASPEEYAQRVERFVREARAAGRIRHPNVVDVYDVGGENAIPYLVMERLHGSTLAASLSEAPLPERNAVEFVLAAARGVAAAHQKGVVHRDLKPDNIFLAATDQGPPVAKVLDFGISRIVTANESLDSLTRTGTILGTPSYMPYEQLRGGAVDARADVYALGVILYEAISGKRPYEACNLHDLVLRIAHDPPTPLAHVQPAARRHVREVVARCLEREPHRRYADAGQLAAALERVLEAPDARESSGPSHWSRMPWVLLALIVVFGFAAAVSALGLRNDDQKVNAHASQPRSSNVSSPSAADPKPTQVMPVELAGASPNAQVSRTSAPESSPVLAAPAHAPKARKPSRNAAPVVVPAEDAKFERAQELWPSDF